jgi:AcrR family transcriptional regulator
MLLDAAMALFSENGVYNTRIEDITEHADIAKGAFYNYFESKDALVAELLGEAVATLEGDYFNELPFNSPEARLLAIVGQHREFLHDHPVYALLLHQARGMLQLKGQVPEKLQQALRDYLSCLSRHFTGPQDADRRTPDEAMHLAALVAGLVSGYRSFVSAAGLSEDPGLLEAAVSRGIASLVYGSPTAG